MAEHTITPSELERILEVLPNPQFTWVNLTNYCDQVLEILREAEKMVPGIKLERVGAFSIGTSLENPTRETIMDIYRSSYGANEFGHPNFTKPRVELTKVSWDLRRKEDERIFESKITMTPEKGFDIEYWEKEPLYIAQLKQALDGTHVKVKIVANDYSKF